MGERPGSGTTVEINGKKPPHLTSVFFLFFFNLIRYPFRGGPDAERQEAEYEPAGITFWAECSKGKLGVRVGGSEHSLFIMHGVDDARITMSEREFKRLAAALPLPVPGPKASDEEEQKKPRTDYG